MGSPSWACLRPRIPCASSTGQGPAPMPRFRLLRRQCAVRGWGKREGRVTAAIFQGGRGLVRGERRLAGSGHGFRRRAAVDQWVGESVGWRISGLVNQWVGESVVGVAVGRICRAQRAKHIHAVAMATSTLPLFCIVTEVISSLFKIRIVQSASIQFGLILI